MNTNCPHCRKQLDLSGSTPGSIIQCPRCTRNFVHSGATPPRPKLAVQASTQDPPELVDWKLTETLLGGFMVKYHCPACGTSLRSSVKDAGGPDTCPDCNVPFMVPLEAAQQAAAISEDHAREKARKREQKEAVRRKKAELRAQLQASQETGAVEREWNSSAPQQSQIQPDRQPHASSLTPCVDCGARISHRATSCPHCGAPNDGSSPGGNEANLIGRSDHQKTSPVTLGCAVLVGLFFLSTIIAAFNGEIDSQPHSTSGGEAVTNSQWDASVWQVKSWLNANLKDPDSLEYLEWSAVVETSDGYIVRVKYRAKNSFGGYVLSNQKFSLDSAGNVTGVVDLLY